MVETLGLKVLTFFSQAYGICIKIETKTFVPANVDKTNAEYFLETLLQTAQKRSLRPGLMSFINHTLKVRRFRHMNRITKINIVQLTPFN